MASRRRPPPPLLFLVPGMALHHRWRRSASWRRHPSDCRLQREASRSGASPYIVVRTQMHGGVGDVSSLVLDFCSVHDEVVGVVLGVVAALVGVGVLDRLQRSKVMGRGWCGWSCVHQRPWSAASLGSVPAIRPDQRAARRIPGAEHGLAGQCLEAGVAAVADAELDRAALAPGVNGIKPFAEALAAGTSSANRRVVADAGRQAVLVDEQQIAPPAQLDRCLPRQS